MNASTAERAAGKTRSMKNLRGVAGAVGCALAACAISAPSLAGSAQCAKRSPAHTVALVELYTSEGCSSCPPADQWLSRIARDSYAQDTAIPLSLHVDYWDRLGWKDRFADPRFNERQRLLAQRSGSRAIYTPGVFLNQREFRNWSSAAEMRDAIRQVNQRPAAADIRLELVQTAPAQLTVHANFSLVPGSTAGRAQAFVALYENRLETDVKAGENGGAVLRHDRVVRAWIGPVEVGRDATKFTTNLPIDSSWKAKDLGVAAFIQEPGTGEVLQAASLAACG